MDLILAFIFGLTQGITEFLPISSSGHLVVLHDIFQIETISDLSFDVALHAGTLLAVLIVFWGDAWRIVQKSAAQTATPERAQNRQLLAAIAVGTVPAAVVGYFLKDIIEQALRAPGIVALMLVLVGILFLVVERTKWHQRELSHMRWLDGLWIGIAQAVALIPGTSRSGITIIAGMSRGLKREQAARFSFLLSIPIVFGAFVLQAQEMISSGEPMDTWVFAVGMITSVLVGIFAIRFLLAFLARASLAAFAYYRFILAAIVLVWIVLR